MLCKLTATPDSFLHIFLFLLSILLYPFYTGIPGHINYQHHLDPGQKTPSIILEVSLLISFCPNFTHFTRRPFVAKIVKMVGNCPIQFFVIILTHSFWKLQSSRVNDSCLKWQFKIGSKLNIVCANKTRAFF